MQECNVKIEAEDNPPDDIAAAVTVASQADQAPVRPLDDDRKFAKGAALALFSISLWAAWFVATRFQSTAGLGLYDMLAIRYIGTGVLLLPLTWRWRHKLKEVRVVDLLLIFAGSGLAYGVTNTAAVTLAPAAEIAALTPGVMPLWTALLSVLFLSERLSRPRAVGFVFTISGVVAIAGSGIFIATRLETAGHVMAILAALLFAGYAIALRRSRLTGLEAAAFVSFASCLIYLPFYFIAAKPAVWNAPLSSILTTFLFQSILANIVSLIAFGRAAALIGPARAAAFAALVPALTLLLGIPFLGEIPTVIDSLAIVAITIGVYLTSGAPLPQKAMFARLTHSFGTRH